MVTSSETRMPGLPKTSIMPPQKGNVRQTCDKNKKRPLEALCFQRSFGGGHGTYAYSLARICRSAAPFSVALTRSLKNAPPEHSSLRSRPFGFESHAYTLRKQKKKHLRCFFISLAEGMGLEPTRLLHPTRFPGELLSHSVNPPDP